MDRNYGSKYCSDNNISIEDIFPTILAMTGIKNPYDVQKLDGKSLTPLFKQKKVKNDSYFYWHYPHVWGPDGPALKLYTSRLEIDLFP